MSVFAFLPRKNYHGMRVLGAFYARLVTDDRSTVARAAPVWRGWKIVDGRRRRENVWDFVFFSQRTLRTRARGTRAISAPFAGRGATKRRASVRRARNTTSPCAAPTASRTATRASWSATAACRSWPSKWLTTGLAVSRRTRVRAGRGEEVWFSFTERLDFSALHLNTYQVCYT